jgi:hypothetical protein
MVLQCHVNRLNLVTDHPGTHMSCTNTLSNEDRVTLLEVARWAIQEGLQNYAPPRVDPADYPETLRSQRATFVTLEIGGNLRGCIGTLEARQPLVEDVAEHAFAAAFEDPRFPRLTEEEFPQLDIHISVLAPSETMNIDSEQELLNRLRPGVDGLTLSLGQLRATFLPAVWDDLPDPYVFLSQLRRKAGLPLDYWSDEIQVERYTTESFGDEDVGQA